MPLTAKENNNRIVEFDRINEKVEQIVKEFNPQKVILFGSYAIGKPTIDSDVDLMVITDTNLDTTSLSIQISMKLKHTFPIDILVRTPQEINKRIGMGDFFIKNIMDNGKVMYERAG